LRKRARIFAAAAILASGCFVGAQQPADLSAALKRADELYAAGKYHEAIEAYKEVLNHDPNNDHAIARIGYAFNRLNDRSSAREWMKRRLEIPGQSPSLKAQILTDVTLISWDQAHLSIVAHRLGQGLKVEEAEALQKLLDDGIESGTKAVQIAPRSAKAFNLLNLLYRDSATLESDSAKQKELLRKADEALRQAIQIYESSPHHQQSTDMLVVPTILAGNEAEPRQAVKIGAATKKIIPDSLKDLKDVSLIVEVFIGRDGKVRLPRLILGQKFGGAALEAARQWEFEPSTFEGHTVQVISTINFAAK
jgi:tetratricopeptide (TPR) repeat protein